jgi:cell division protein FtsB
VVDRPARDEDKDRWSREYDAFRRGEASPLSGTPIDQWPPLNKSQVAELRALHIMTVEALADLPDNQVQRIGIGGQSLKAKAAAWLQAAAGSAPITEMRAEIETLTADNDMLRRQIRDLSSKGDPAKVDELKAENESLKAQVKNLEDAAVGIEKENADLKAKVKGLEKSVSDLESDLEGATAPKAGAKTAAAKK